ncbi:MAG: RagB/SusD family nutrient uptake outer membrane protein, partial [Balneola sp.]
TGVSDADYTTMVLASAKFLQGISLSYIGQFFDQGYILDETTDVNTIALSPYADVLAAADQKLQDAADLASSLPAGVTLGDGYISGYDDVEMNSEFVELINTQRARIKVLAPRSPADVAGVDWDAVKDFTADGLSYDFSPEGDDQFWFSYTLLYGNLGSWVRVDQSIVSLMDPSQPSDYPSDGVSPGQATSDDDRLTSDFRYIATVPFPPSRGYWFFSNYNTDRYNYHSFFTTAEGPMPHILQAENDLMYAEAVIRTTDAANRQAAVDAINNTRVTRGDLTPLTIADSDADILEAIQYERTIELF